MFSRARPCRPTRAGRKTGSIVMPRSNAGVSAMPASASMGVGVGWISSVIVAEPR